MSSASSRPHRKETATPILDQALGAGSPVRIFGPIHVSVGPVYVSIQSGRCEHRLAERFADRAPCQGFMWFLAVIRPIRWANGVQGVAGSNPAVPIRLFGSNAGGPFCSSLIGTAGFAGSPKRARTRGATKSHHRTVGSSRASTMPSNRSRCPPRDERRAPKAPGAQSGRGSGSV